MLRRLLLAAAGGGAFSEADMNHVSGLVYNNATQTLSHNVSTAFTLNSEGWDPGGFHSTVTENTKITVPTGHAGVYHFLGGTWTAGSVGADIHIFFRLNGSADGPRLSRRLYSKPAGPDLGYMQVEMVINLADGDYVEFFGYVDDSPGSSSKTLGHATIIDAQTAVAWFKVAETP